MTNTTESNKIKSGPKTAKKQNQIHEFKLTIQWMVNTFEGKGLYKMIQSFLASHNIKVSVGTINKYFKKYDIKPIKVHSNYGRGKQAMKGRVLRDEFVCKTNGEHFKRYQGTWVKAYVIIALEQGYNPSEDDTVIHHKDNNHKNNNIENLAILRRADHTRYHIVNYWTKKFIEKLEKGLL